MFLYLGNCFIEFLGNLFYSFFYCGLSGLLLFQSEGLYFIETGFDLRCRNQVLMVQGRLGMDLLDGVLMMVHIIALVIIVTGNWVIVHGKGDSASCLRGFGVFNVRRIFMDPSKWWSFGRARSVLGAVHILTLEGLGNKWPFHGVVDSWSTVWYIHVFFR